MNVLVPTSWHLVLRVTLCFLVFYATFYFLISFMNGMTLMSLVHGASPGIHAGEGTDPNALIWLKFCAELAARMASAMLLVKLGVPRYRFALLQEGSLHTGFTAIFARWALPMLVLTIVTLIGMHLPVLKDSLLAWMAFHLLFAVGFVHYMMVGVTGEKRLRMVEVV